MGCGDNTTGRNCQKCNPGYYPNPKKFRTDPEYCRPCLCDSNGALENRCDETSGQCVCNEGYTGRRYDSGNAGQGYLVVPFERRKMSIRNL